MMQQAVGPYDISVATPVKDNKTNRWRSTYVISRIDSPATIVFRGDSDEHDNADGAQMGAFSLAIAFAATKSVKERA